jgi:hypothetical protein
MGSGNQERRAFLQGRTQLVHDTEGRAFVKVLETDTGNEFGRGPTHELGNPQEFDAGKLSAWPAFVEFEIAQDLSVFVALAPPDDNGGQPQTRTQSVFNIPPQYSGAGNTPFGAVAALGRIQAGHAGCDFDWFFNMTPGGNYRVALTGSQVRFSAMLIPKYFLADDTFAHVRVYETSAGQPLVISTWNTPSPDLITRTLAGVPSQVDIFTAKAFCESWASSGRAEIDTRSRTVRNFWGSVRAQGGARSASTICPVPNGATHVDLIGGALRGAGPVSLEFWQVARGDLDLGNAIGSKYFGSFPAQDANGLTQLPIKLVNNCQFIAVTVETPAGFAGDDILFELSYYLGA